MVQWKTAVPPMRKQWSNCSFALSYRYDISLVYHTNSWYYYCEPCHPVRSLQQFQDLWVPDLMVALSNGNIFRVTGHLCRELSGSRWIPRTKASDSELWYFSLICVWINGWVNNRKAGDLRRYRVHYDATVMFKSLAVTNEGERVPTDAAMSVRWHTQL